MLKGKAKPPITAYNQHEPPEINGHKAMTSGGWNAEMQKTLKYSGIIPITTSVPKIMV
jgi:hypothetical protein